MALPETLRAPDVKRIHRKHQSKLARRKIKPPLFQLQPLEGRLLYSAAPTISGPSTATSGAAYALSLAAHSNKTVDHWTIKWGDGSANQTVAGNPASVTHTYVTLASDHITASVTDPDGTYTAPTAGVSVGPLFYTTHPGSGYSVGQAYVLTSTFSDPGGGTLTGYTVTWGDGSSANTYGSAITHFTHTYTSDNGGSPYSETMVATTNLPTHFTATSGANVAPPTLTLTAPASSTQGAAYNVTAVVSSGQTVGSSYAFAINWGDGSSPQNVTAAPGAFSYSYAEPGSYGVSMTVTGDNGSSGASANVNVALASATVSVSDGDPTLTAGVTTNATDSYSNPGGDVLNSLGVAWGDGNTDTIGGDPGLSAHAYAHPGTYTITDTFYTDHTSYTAAAVVHVVDGAGLSVSLFSDTEGRTSSLQTTFTDPAGNTPSAYTVHWGDGNSNTYGLSPNHHGTFDHVYTLSGTYTATAIATTPNGTYSATDSATVGLYSPMLSVVDPFAAADGVAFPLAVFFVAGDEIGNLSSNYPVANHPTTYNVAWGDGSTGTYTSTTFSHIYYYDTGATATNSYEYTVTAHNLDATASYSSLMEVLPHLAGTLTANAPSLGTEGTYFTASATFTDAAQGSNRNNQGANDWKIYWGDGSVNVASQYPGNPPIISYSQSHSYAEPGTYQMTFVASYFEGTTQSVIYNSTKSIVIAPHVPTMTITANTTTAAIGDPVSLYPTYTDTVGDHPTHDWIVTWGDGTSDEYDNFASPPEIVHTYAIAGTYHPTISVTACDLTGPVTATASLTIT